MPPASRVRLAGAALAAGLLVAGCRPTQPPIYTHTGNADPEAPLGPNYVLLPLGSDDASLLGRVLPTRPEPGRALEEIASGNPCLEQLGQPLDVGMTSTFEDAEELAATSAARATLGIFGFSGEAKHATHFVYKLQTSRRQSLRPSEAYTACCRDRGCGFGTVVELVYGDGDYSAAQETTGRVQGDVVTIASAQGSASLRVLHKRHVHGWLAAKILVSEQRPAVAARVEPKLEPPPLSALGAQQGVVLDLFSASAQVKELYEHEQIKVCPDGDDWVFCDQVGPMTERVFAYRYDELLATDQLARYDRVHLNKAPFFLGLVPGVAGGVWFFGTLATLKKNADVPVAAIAGGGSLFVVGSTVALTSLGYDRKTAHWMSRADAEQLVDRYNRELLRKVTSDVKESRFDDKTSSLRRRLPVQVATPRAPSTPPALVAPAPSWSLAPVVSPGFLGLSGRF